VVTKGEENDQMATTDPTLLTSDELQAMRGFDSVTLFFARATVEGYISEDYTGPEISCAYPDLGPSVGYVVTSEWTSMDPESPDLNFLDYYEWITHQPPPPFVVSKDVDVRAGRTASFGSQQARTLKALGVAGVLSGVGLHKVSQVKAAGMPTWHTGIAPAHGSFHIVRWGAPVEVGRVTWQTGDLAFGDENGVIRIPAAIARDVLHQAQESRAHEQTYYDVIDAPDFTVAKLRQWLETHISIYPPVDEAMAAKWWAANESRVAPRGSGASDRS
jgi:regulator of RNase E activity RraA